MRVLTLPDGGQSLSVLVPNGSPAFLQVADVAAGTGIVDTVVAGTGITVDATDPANPVVANAASQQLLYWGSDAGGPVNVDIVCVPFNAASHVIAQEASWQIPVAFAGNLAALRAQLNAGVVSNDNLIITVRKNGVDTAQTCTIAIGASSANDLVHLVPVVVGDLVSVKISALGAGWTTTSTMWISLTLLP